MDPQDDIEMLASVDPAQASQREPLLSPTFSTWYLDRNSPGFSTRGLRSQGLSISCLYLSGTISNQLG